MTAIAEHPRLSLQARLRDPAAWIATVDILPVLVAASLPWSTSLVAIFAVMMLIAMGPFLDVGDFLGSLKRPICVAPLALFALALVGTLWSDAAWGARLYAVSPTAKLLVLPVLFYHFACSQRGMWVCIAFLVSCTLMVAASWIVAIDPALTLKAKDVASQRQHKRRETRLVKQAGNRMEDIMAQMGEGQGQQTLNLVVKADVQGSAEALRESLTAITTDAIRVNVIASGVGGITESDATLAAASKAVIIGFNVRADASARRIIESNSLDLRYFSIIYDVIDQVKQVATGLLGMEVREEIIGIAQVRDVFRSSKFGAIAGCMVIEGTVKRSKPIRVLRDNTVVFQGELESLRRFKENVEEVRNGTECGIGVKQYNDVKPGDQIECFERIEFARTL